MKINQIIINETSAGATGSGSVATVSSPLGNTQSRNASIYGNQKVGSLFKGKKTNKPYANSLNEGKMKDLALDLSSGPDGLKDKEFKEKYGKSKQEMRKSMEKKPQQPAKKVDEARLEEEDKIIAVGKGNKLKPGLLSKPENSINPTDTVKIDVPLLIRLLEYAREDASSDMDLHDLAEKLVDRSRRGKTLTMKDYEYVVEGISSGGVIAGGGVGEGVAEGELATYLVSVMDASTKEHWRIEVKVTSPEAARERAEAMGFKVLGVKEKPSVAEGVFDFFKKKEAYDPNSDPEMMREFERSGGYDKLDIMGWQLGWAAAKFSKGENIHKALTKLYYQKSPFPFDERSFKLAWVAYNKHHGPEAAFEGVAEGAGRSFLEIVDDFLVDYAGKQSGDTYTWTNGKKTIQVEMDPTDPSTVHWALGITGRTGKTNWVESGSDSARDALRVVKNFAKNALPEGVAEGSASRTCPTCDGSGEDNLDHSKPCHRCHGKGHIPQKQGMVEGIVDTIKKGANKAWDYATEPVDAPNMDTYKKNRAKNIADIRKKKSKEQGVAEAKLDEKFASKQQAKLMYAAAGDKDVAKKTGVSQKVAKEFIKKSHGQKVSKLPTKVKAKKD